MIPREPRFIRGLRRDYTSAPKKISKAYLLGVLHDATERRLTYRVAQKECKYLEFLSKQLKKIGCKSWIYKEGIDRNLYVIEFSKSKLLLNHFQMSTREDKVDYIRGYFDAEGGIAKRKNVRYYIYFAQKNYEDLAELRGYLKDVNIECGVIHNPSYRVDPDYFRFYISSRSYRDFARLIGSWHPTKRHFLRMKI